MTIIFNGNATGPQTDATEANAIESARRFVADLATEGVTFEREPANDGALDVPGGRGWYGFRLRLGGHSTTLDIPGVDPDLVQLGKPWVSPRVYVDGMSWLWGYGLGIAANRLGIEEDDR